MDGPSYVMGPVRRSIVGKPSVCVCVRVRVRVVVTGVQEVLLINSRQRCLFMLLGRGCRAWVCWRFDVWCGSSRNPRRYRGGDRQTDRYCINSYKNVESILIKSVRREAQGEIYESPAAMLRVGRPREATM